MKKMTIDEILAATCGELLEGCDETYITGVKHDSRFCGKGDMFVAVIGKNQDGHKYIPEVVKNGCRTLLVSHTDSWLQEVRDKTDIGLNIIKADDTVHRMGDLAAYYLQSLNALRIAVTGSVGKTSVRDMTYFVLSEKYKTGRNLRNFNNDIGLPISIFRFDEDTGAVVLEMGMDNFGEIRRLSSIVKPHIGIITNIGVAHIEKLGTRDGIFRAKTEITDNILPASEGGALIYARDDEYLNPERIKGDFRQISVGTDGRSDYVISDVDDFGLDGIEFTLEHEKKAYKIRLGVPGVHNAVNATIAIAAGQLAGIDIETAAAGLAKADLTGSRLRRVTGKSVTVIDDTYNANPDSMKNALKVLEKSKCNGKKTAILGDMMELGERSRQMHYGVGIFARGCRIDKLITVGDLAGEISKGASCVDIQTAHYDSKEELIKNVKTEIHSGDLILVKGSRGMKMEEIVQAAAEI